ncbi:MAG: hypothetical protein AAF171_07155 [Cyanobacteria bacterium P01_A01_bin.116]
MKFKPLAVTPIAIKSIAIKSIATTPRWLTLSLFCLLPITSSLGFAAPALAEGSQIVSYSFNKSGVNSYRDSLSKLRSTSQASTVPKLERSDTGLTDNLTIKGKDDNALNDNALNGESTVRNSDENSIPHSRGVKESIAKKRVLFEQTIKKRLEQTKTVVKTTQASETLAQELPFVRGNPFALIEATRQNSVDQLHAGQFTAQAGDFGTQAFPKSLSVKNALSIQQLKTDVSQLPVRLKSTVAAAKTRLPAIVEGNYYEAGQAKVGQVRTDLQNKLNTTVSSPVNSMRDRIKTLQQTIKEKISTLLQQIGQSASSTAEKLQQP